MKCLIIFLLSLLPLLVEAQSISPLHAWVADHEGVWMVANQDPVLDEDATATWVVQLDRAHLVGNRLAVMVSEYCRPAIAEVLWFKWEDNGLTYVGAQRDGLPIELKGLAYARIERVAKESRPTLRLQLQEWDQQWTLEEQLIHMPVPLQPGWAWGWQHYLIGFLAEGCYEVWDESGAPTTLVQALDRPNVLADLAFVEAHALLYPMFEEICVRSPYPLILLGDGRPGGEVRLIVIDWQENGIHLFDGHHARNEAGNMFPIHKGKHLCTIIPAYTPVLEPQLQSQ
ncbi:MAG: hypothetical protein AAF399_05095 [Bacteroidota bacterium]